MYGFIRYIGMDMMGKDKKRKADGIGSSGGRKADEAKKYTKLKQYIISGLLTLAVTAAGLGSFFAIQRRFQNSPMSTIRPGGIIEVQEEVLCAASTEHSAWISNGKLYIAGAPFEDQEAVANWQRLVQVSVSDDHLVALDHTGQVYAIGNNLCQQCEVDARQFVVSVAAGMYCTVIVLADGEVQVFGVMDENERAGLVSEKNARRVVLSENHAVVLRRDGSVAAYGSNESGQCDVSDWSKIEKISAGRGYTVGVTSGGKVLFAGEDSYGQKEVEKWRKIRDIAAGTVHVVGIKEDGTVVAAGRNAQGECEVGKWKDMEAVAAGYDHTIGMDRKGSFRAIGYNGDGQCDLSGMADRPQEFE